MSIIIVDNFQVNLSNPIDNRFVVGSQSIASTPVGLYPTPFYAYRDDIVYKYPGLRIWDFNDNVPYFWNGNAWINENTTGALVQNAATGFTGFKNYIVKFENDQTLLTKSNIFDTLSNIGIGLINSEVQPGTIAGMSQPVGTLRPAVGLHVSGNIRAGYDNATSPTPNSETGWLIGKINANYIVDGLLSLNRITAPPTAPASSVYVLKNTTGDPGGTSWDLLSNIVPPIPGVANLTQTTTTPVGVVSTGNISAGLNGSNQYTFKPLISTGLQITDTPGSNEIRIESKAGYSLGNSLDGEDLYIGLDGDFKHKFKRIKSSSLQVLPDPSGNSITVEIPATFEGTDYYVNGGYFGAEQLGTRSKPFRTLKACINKILNRTSNSGPTSFTRGFINGIYDPSLPNSNSNLDGYGNPGQMGLVTPDTFTSSINNGQPYQKWEIRTGPNQPKPTYLNDYTSNLPGRGAVRVIIQSYTEIDENLAINGVTYFLEKLGVSYIYSNSDYYNDPGTPANGTPFTYLFDMTPLAGTANLSGNAATGVPKGNPIYGGSKPFQMDYGLNCRLEGSGDIGFYGWHKNRKGFFRSKGVNSYDFSLAANKINNTIPVVNDPDNRIDENDCSLFIGNEAGYIILNMDRLPEGYEAPHTTLTGFLYDSGYPENKQITREGVTMSGYQTTAVPDYGAIQVEGRNMMFGESLFLAGTLVVNCSEQHMVYAKDYGTIYSESGRIYMRRHYQKVLYSRSEFVAIDREQTPVQGENGRGVFGDGYYKITSISATNSVGSIYTNWKNPAFFRQDSWRDTAGNPKLAITLPTSLSDPLWVGLSVKTTTNYQSSLVPSGVGQNPGGSVNGSGTPNTYGSTNVNPIHKGRMVRAQKVYRPCDHVYDIYLKNGAQWNQGGDFYTQQNTGANQGGACAFLGIENNIPITGDDTHPPFSFGQSTTGCSFRANGGGFVSNLLYNYFIKYILDISYLTDRYAYKHNITFKSLKIDSGAYNSVIGVFKTSGATFPNYTTNSLTLEGNSAQNWTQFIYIGAFTSCVLLDYQPYSSLRIPFSNISINNGLRVDISNTAHNAAGGALIRGLRNDGRDYPVNPANTIWYYYGLVSLSGTAIELSTGSINTSIPAFNGNSEALFYGYPVGGIYLDYLTTGVDGGDPILKVVKNV